jgi:cytochrome c oxidase subunit IV
VENAMSEHVVPTRTYVLIFLGLILLTSLTTAVAFVDLGALNTVAALAIAVCKMLLVILFFMHVKYMPGLTKIVVVAGFFWLAILLALTLGDIFTRAWTPVPEGWPTSATFSRQACRSTSDIVLHSMSMKMSIRPCLPEHFATITP